MGLIERKYEIAVCTICGSDNIFSTEHDSWCDDCREWMNAEVVVVVPEAASAGAVEALAELAGAIRCYSRGALPAEDRLDDALDAADRITGVAFVFQPPKAAEEMRRLLNELVDPDPCWFDHHGACQAHGLQNPCPHEQAKKLLSEQNTDEGERTP
jgi:hypothetical protein